MIFTKKRTTLHNRVKTASEQYNTRRPQKRQIQYANGASEIRRTITQYAILTQCKKGTKTQSSTFFRTSAVSTTILTRITCTSHRPLSQSNHLRKHNPICRTTAPIITQISAKQIKMGTKAEKREERKVAIPKRYTVFLHCNEKD